MDFFSMTTFYILFSLHGLLFFVLLLGVLAETGSYMYFWFLLFLYWVFAGYYTTMYESRQDLVKDEHIRSRCVYASHTQKIQMYLRRDHTASYCNSIIDTIKYYYAKLVFSPFSTHSLWCYRTHTTIPIMQRSIA